MSLRERRGGPSGDWQIAYCLSRAASYRNGIVMCRPSSVRLAMVKKFAAEQSVMTHRLFCFFRPNGGTSKNPLPLSSLQFSFIEKCLLGHRLRKKNSDRRRQVQHLTNFLDLAQRKFGFTSCLSVKCASAHVQKLAHFPDLDSLCLHSVVQCLRVHNVHLLCKCPLRHYLNISFSIVKHNFVFYETLMLHK